MPGLADIVLSASEIIAAAERGEDDDPELAAMQRELAELQARRRGESVTDSAQAPDDGPANTDLADTAATDQLPSLRQKAARQGAASLADTILNSTSGEDALDQELEHMENELQRHLSQYRTQCQEAPSPVAAKTTMTAPNSSNAAEVDAPDAAAGIGNVDAMPDAELTVLQVQAQRMDEAFPELDMDADASNAQPQRRYPQLRSHERSTARDTPLEEMEDMRSALDELDIRLRAMQQRQVMQDRAPKEDALVAATEGNAVLAHIRAQNQHLRARLQGSNPKGLLNLDRSFFTADGTGGGGFVGQAVR